MTDPKPADWEIRWEPRAGGRKPEHPSDPAYPKGKYLVAYDPKQPSCRGDLPYVLWPERGLGLLYVTCLQCGQRTAVTTAGRPDDPVSLTQNCRVN